MGFADELKENLKDLDGETISLALSTAISLIRYGTELIEALSNDISDEELVELIGAYRKASTQSIEKMDESIEKRKQEENAAN